MARESGESDKHSDSYSITQDHVLMKMLRTCSYENVKNMFL